MLNVLRPAISRVLTPVGEALAKTPVTPNAVTVIGTVGVAGGALGLFPMGELFPGAFTCTIFVLLDMLDGVLARIKGTSGKWGAFVDSTMDRIADGAIFSGLVWWFFNGGHDPTLGGVSLFCLVTGALVSYAKARAEGLGLRCDVGLIERPERMLMSLIAVGVSGLGVPYILPIGLWGLAVGSAITFGQRVQAVYQSAKGLGRVRRDRASQRALHGGRVPTRLEGHLPGAGAVGAGGVHGDRRYRVASPGQRHPAA